jgi:hypothetical protein
MKRPLDVGVSDLEIGNVSQVKSISIATEMLRAAQ